MPRAPLSKSELAEAYPEEEFAPKLLTHVALSRILGESIIRRNYTIPDSINNALHFTDSGREVIDALVRKEKVDVKEARLVAYLTLVHITPLVDFDEVDTRQLVSTIGSEIKQRKILYPYIYGRDLYDRAAERFADERDYLRHEDTIALLEDAPVGVFHIANFLVGPYGLIETEFERHVSPRTSIPLQHCPDPTCARVHPVQLSTSSEARIVRARSAINKVLENIGQDPSDWNGYLVDKVERRDEDYNDRSMQGVPFLIGDALSDGEMQHFFTYVLKNSSGSLLSTCATLGQKGAPDAISEQLSRAEMHQLLLTEDDKSLAGYLDGAIEQGVIEIPDGEVRILRVNRRHRSTAWNLRPQLSKLGFRSTTGDLYLANLRLSALVRELYDQNSESDTVALKWLLRDSEELLGDDGNVEMAIDSLVRREDPATVLRRFIFARPENLERAGRFLATELRAHDDESTTISRALWKLGFRLPAPVGPSSDYWNTHNEFGQAARSTPVTSVRVSSSLRAAAAHQAVALENYLYQAMVFSWWALLHDHYGAGQQFVFRPSAAESFARSSIAAAASRESYEGLDASAKLTLAPLIGSFGLLARELESREGRAKEYKRPAASLPRFAGHTSMQAFPFVHTTPYLDLDPAAQQSVKAVLRDVTARLNGSQIAMVRNQMLHATPVPPQPGVILDALDDVGRAIKKMEATGLTPQLFSLADVRKRSWGRSIAEFRGDSGDVIEIHSPSHYEWLPMPSGAEQVIVRGATFGNGAESLRFRRGHDSAYEDYWASYPRRREPSMSVGFDRSDTLASTVDGDRNIASRAD
ncbi:hypothetical protein ACO229_18855 [Promicromonospora sp. MS192]|uniref:hypothetical protein n=1 Tax=Promicromonospora sp. MS192 TaxID=3412684 RepID=UPI003C307804